MGRDDKTDDLLKEVLLGLKGQLEQQGAALESQAKVTEELRAEIADLRAASGGAAALAHRVPPKTAAAPPRGYKAIKDFQRGVWFRSPFGPHLEVKFCDCGVCSDVREHHFYCVVCKTGPHDIVTPKQIYKRAFMAPGDLWGITHFACAGPCALRFMAMFGEPAAERAAPPAVPELAAASTGPDPMKPAVLVGSD